MERRKLWYQAVADCEARGEPYALVSVLGVAGSVPREPASKMVVTGEHSYEINIQANYGKSVWEKCMEAGKDYNITPYGTETMHLLRAEKGFIIVGQDTDATMTPIDLQMDWIVSKKKYDFIGKRSLYRSDTIKEDRKQLVGLLTDNPNEILEEGAQIVSELGQKPVEMIGHVTSSYFSPNLNKSIALAVVKGGKKITTEGNESPRTVVIEFPSFMEAKTFFYSEEYQEAHEILKGIVVRHHQIIEGT